MLTVLSDNRQISPENLNFALGVLLIHTNGAIYNIYSSDASATDKLNKIVEITNIPLIKELYSLESPVITQSRNKLAVAVNQLRQEILFGKVQGFNIN